MYERCLHFLFSVAFTLLSVQNLNLCNLVLYMVKMGEKKRIWFVIISYLSTLIIILNGLHLHRLFTAQVQLKSQVITLVVVWKWATLQCHWSGARLVIYTCISFRYACFLMLIQNKIIEKNWQVTCLLMKSSFLSWLMQPVVWTVIQTVFLPYVNAHLGQGFPLPIIHGFTVQNAEIIFSTSKITVCSDVSYAESQYLNQLLVYLQ